MTLGRKKIERIPVLHRTIFLALTMIILSFAISLSIHNQAHADEWGYQVSQQVEPGKQGTFSLSPAFTLKKAELVLSSGKIVVKKKFQELKPATPYRVQFRPPLGNSIWDAKLTGITTDGSDYSVSFEFTVLSAKTLTAKVITSESSLEEGRLLVEANNPLDHAELEAFGDEGEPLWTDTVSFKPASKKRSRRYLARYDRSPIPRRLEVKIFDDYESWLSIRLVRWYAEVPHDDVLFESNSSELKRSEENKMKDAIQTVADELKKYRRAMNDSSAQVDLQLYIAGYTDTVGNSSENLKLSQARARSIATYFKRNKVEIPIYYTGFGEQALFVKTPDQTDEVRNRRVLYIVANFPPSGENFPQARWQKSP